MALNMVYYSSCMEEGVFMLVLPLLVNDVAVNILLDFKKEDVKKVKNQLDSLKQGIGASDIIIGKVNLKSVVKDEKLLQNPRVITNFIRKNISYSSKDITSVIVNTKKYKDSDFYDTYYLPLPNKKSNEVIDYIYGSLVNSIRQSTPPSLRKEKLLLNMIGLDELFNIEFLNRVALIKNTNNNSLYLREQLINEGYEEQLDILDFFNSLDYKVNDNGVVLTSELDNIIAFFNDTYKEKKDLVNYKNIALSNFESYVCLSAFNNYIYGSNLNWIVIPDDKQKILIHKLYSNDRVA